MVSFVGIRVGCQLDHYRLSLLLIIGFKEELRENFERVEECRLKSTRSDSSEIYIIAHRYVYSNLRNNELVL